MNSQSSPVHPLLEKICTENRNGSNGPRPSRHLSPFGIDITLPPAGRWDAATTGAVILAFAGGHLDRSDSISPRVEDVIGRAPGATHFGTMAALREWAGTDDGICRTCGGVGATGRHPCGECGGTGEVECDYGHDHECPECDSTGVRGKLCQDCNGRFLRARIEGRIENCAVNRCLLAGLVWDLSGDSVSIGTTDLGGYTAVFFHGAGWVLAVACLTGQIPDAAPRLELQAAGYHTHEAPPCPP